MEKLWAPWRMEYIAAPSPQGCFLCDAWKSDDQEHHHILHRGEGAYVLMNRYPYNNGHMMVATSEHTGDLNLISPQVRLEIMDMIVRGMKALKKAVSPQGFNVGINIGSVAGAGLSEHLHVHIVPRWSGDTNYMPVISDTKVISDHIDSTYMLLKKYFR